MKICRTCGLSKPESEFPSRKGYLFGDCRECYNKRQKARRSLDREKFRAFQRAWYQRHREKDLRKKRERHCTEKKTRHDLQRFYGITLEDYNELLDAQGGLCVICGKEENVFDRRTNRVRRLHVDHDHVTGEIRGLLCSRCNFAIGYLRDDYSIAEAAAAYLRVFHRQSKEQLT